MITWQKRSFSVLFRKPVFWLIIAITTFTTYFVVTVWFRHHNLYTAQFDLGNMVQVMWQSLHGHWFQMIDPGTATLVSRAAIHTDFLLLIYLPFYAIWTSPLTLLFLQVLAVASGAIPVFLLARKKITPLFGLAMSGLYLLYPPLLWAILFDVHAVVLVTPLILWAWWALETRRFWFASICLALALLGKEEIGLMISLSALYWLRYPATRRFAFITLVTGISWSAFMVGWVIPHARNAPGHFALGYYSAYGQTTKDILINLFTRPWIFVRDLFQLDALHYYFNLLLPVGGLAILGLPIILLASPEIAINVLSSNHNLRTIFFQYTSAITPYIFLATVIGTAHAYHWIRPRVSPERMQKLYRGLFVLLLCSSAVSIWRWAPLRGTKHDHDVIGVFRESPYRLSIDTLQRLVPPNERLAATNNVAVQFANRDAIWGFPARLDLAEGVIVLRGSDYDLLPKEQINQKVEELLVDPAWELIYHRSEIFYFRKVTIPPNHK